MGVHYLARQVLEPPCVSLKIKACPHYRNGQESQFVTCICD
ncbi:hypothetical protein IMCC3088_1083 [Aequoribacter fuscus]|uniref:Uncharacterized protein n=1 Tax=Aequoribacter fuscus TaxID=2518989 RepID=F3L0Z1_9GAMM|nr:hypothetical protein IMCC3088_1083 [Aequoribacter fuscus]